MTDSSLGKATKVSLCIPHQLITSRRPPYTPVTLCRCSAAAGQWCCSRTARFCLLSLHQTQAHCGTAVTMPTPSQLPHDRKTCRQADGKMSRSKCTLYCHYHQTQAVGRHVTTLNHRLPIHTQWGNETLRLA